MGDWQKNKNVYCPDQFYFGQSGGRSDIAGKTNQPAYWDWAREVHGNYLLKLTAPRSTIDNLHGFHRGYWLHQNGQDNGLIEIATLDDKKERLKEWITVVGKEADNIGAVPVIWHPDIHLDDLYIATSRTIVEITASSVDDFQAKWKAALEKQEAV